MPSLLELDENVSDDETLLEELERVSLLDTPIEDTVTDETLLFEAIELSVRLLVAEETDDSA